MYAVPPARRSIVAPSNGTRFHVNLASQVIVCLNCHVTYENSCVGAPCAYCAEPTVDLREEAVRRAASYDPARELMRWLQRPLGRI